MPSVAELLVAELFQRIRSACLEGVVARPVDTVAVIGAGTMGAGIAACLLAAVSSPGWTRASVRPL